MSVLNQVIDVDVDVEDVEESIQVDENRESGGTGWNPSRISETGRRNSDRSNPQDDHVCLENEELAWRLDPIHIRLAIQVGRPTVCANCRTISLISHSSNLMLQVILERMRDKGWVRNSWRTGLFPAQQGYDWTSVQPAPNNGKGKSAQATAIPVFHRFWETFDTVSHKKLSKTMFSMGFARHLVSLVKSLCEMQKSYVRKAGGKSHWFNVLKALDKGAYYLRTSSTSCAKFSCVWTLKALKWIQDWSNETAIRRWHSVNRLISWASRDNDAVTWVEHEN